MEQSTQPQSKSNFSLRCHLLDNIWLFPWLNSMQLVQLVLPQHKSANVCVPKNVPLCHFPYLRQMFTNFQKFFIGGFCRQLAITQLLNLTPHFNCVTTLPCKRKLSKITKITRIHMQKFSSETIFTNFYTQIKLCSVSDAFLMFVNKNTEYYRK